MIAFDLDDTLLRDDMSVSGENVRVIAKARAQGIAILPASGRRYSSMLRALAAIGHEGPVITLNGAKVLEHPSGQALYEKYIPLALCVEIARYAKEKGIYLQSYVGEDFEYERDCEESAKYARFSGGGGGAVGDLATFLIQGDKPSQKLLFFIEDEDAMARVERDMHARYDGKLSVFRSKSFYLEMTHLEATKGLALAYICREKGVLPQQVMAIGDGENDLSMMQWAGVGVAVQNAGELVRAQADCVTASNMDDGVALAIGRFALDDEKGSIV